MKILIQRLWHEKIDWDDVIPSKMSKNWQDWHKELSLLSSVTIPRRLSPKENVVQDYQLLGFADASTSTYGGVLYLRTLFSDASVTVAIVTSKMKVAPLKKLTVPKLQLYSHYFWQCCFMLLPKISPYLSTRCMLGLTLL